MPLIHVGGCSFENRTMAFAVQHIGDRPGQARANRLQWFGRGTSSWTSCWEFYHALPTPVVGLIIAHLEPNCATAAGREFACVLATRTPNVPRWNATGWIASVAAGIEPQSGCRTDSAYVIAPTIPPCELPLPPPPPEFLPAPPSSPHAAPSYSVALWTTLAAVIVLAACTAVACYVRSVRRRSFHLQVSRDRAQFDLNLLHRQIERSDEQQQGGIRLESLDRAFVPPPSITPPASLPPGPPSSGGRSGKGSSASGSDAGGSSLADKFKAVYEATIATVRVGKWEEARAVLRPRLDAAVRATFADRFEDCAKQLWVLARMHGKLEPERAFAKLREIVSAMSSECGMPQEVVVAVYSFFETNILAYGAVEFVVEGGFVLPPSDVPALLDRYNWRKNDKRAHVELLLSMCLRAFADFESDMKAASDAGPSIVAVEGSMRRARGRLDAAVQRALQKHGKTGAQGITAEAFSGKIARLAEAREAKVRLELQGRLAALELVSLESAEPAAASSSSAAAEVHEPQAPVDVSEEPQSRPAVEVETEQERLAKQLEETSLE